MSNTQTSFALITGASSGIGIEFAKELANKGYNLLLVSNQEKELKETVLSLRDNYNVVVEYFYADLALNESAKEVYDFCKNQNYQIEVLVNNAGIFKYAYMLDLNPDFVTKSIILHNLTPILLSKYFAKDMKDQGKGYILNMASASAWFAYPGISLYATTKSALRIFSLAFGQEIKSDGVRVSVLCPGAINTGLYNIGPRLVKIALGIGIMKSPEFIARKGIKGLLKGKKQIVPGLFTKIIILLSKIIPLGLVGAISNKIKKA